MSALTDLFSAMATKIRSKTGTQTTYTPSEMVSDGIDDVFDAGVASVPQPTSITPSNASPVSLTANTAVNPTASGYAIASYTSVTPSDSNPPSISSGDIVKLSASGYLYATQQSGGMTQTTLWTNSTPTSGFTVKTANLSDSIENYDYIGIAYRVTTASSSRPTEVLVKSRDLQYAISSYSNTNFPSITVYSDSTYYARYITYSSNTQLLISAASKIGATGSSTTKAIPLYIYGYKL